MKIESKQLKIILICGVVGSVLMAASDWLMIYGDPTYAGNLAWLTVGVTKISSQRNAFALAFAFPAVVLYALALVKMGCFFKDAKESKIYQLLTTIGMTPWLALHLFYVMILFTFSYLANNGYQEIMYVLCENMFNQFSFVIMIGEVLMVLPFVYFMLQTLKGKTVFDKTFGYINPLTLFVGLKLITMLMPNNAFRLAFTNGLMSETMLIWFILVYLKAKKIHA